MVFANVRIPGLVKTVVSILENVVIVVSSHARDQHALTEMNVYHTQFTIQMVPVYVSMVG